MDFKNVNILVLGDVMLDQYWFGATSRISPEAPVPVVHVNRMEERPGGAANVALGVAALCAKPSLLGIVGQDDASDRLRKFLDKSEIAHQLHPLEGSSTITKLRVLSRNQQMIRLDTEQLFSLSFNAEFNDQFRKQYLLMLEKTDAVILSDYNKGTLMDAPWFIAMAREKNIPVIIDPKSSDFSIYRGASVLTPNMKEFEAVVGPCTSDEMLVDKARNLLKVHQIETLVITRSEHGMSVITECGSVTHIAASAREVHDVTGAGDTVVAVLATALASKMPVIQAAKLSNIAAGIAVGKLGAATVTIPEISKALITITTEDAPTLGVMTEEALLAAIRISKARGEKIVFTNGCFDILHAGHVLYLEQAKRLGDRVIVAVNSDDSVKRLKGPTRPINTEEDRMSVLAGLKSVDWVVPFCEDTPERIIQEISPDVLVKGGDYHEVNKLPGAAYVLSQGGTVELLGLKEGRSTTKLINSIASLREASVV